MIIQDKRAQYWKSENAEHHLDVRPVLEEGGEPYSVIMDAVRQVGREDGLSLHILFDPVPLKKQLERMNYICESTKLEQDHWLLRIDPKS